MSLRIILSPDKEKIMLDVFLSAIWLVAVFNVTELGFQRTFSTFDLQTKILVATLNIMVFLVLYYPLSCGLTYICARLTGKESSNGKDVILAVILVAVFNPVLFSLIAIGMNKADTEVLNRPCGLEIIGFPEYSAARESGLRVGDTITSVEGKATDTTDALLNSLKDKKEGDIIAVGTEGGEYKIRVALNPEKKFPILGVNVKQRYCTR